MKILFLSTTYPGLSGRGYGLGTAVSHTASAMAAAGHEVHVLCSSGRRRTSKRNGVVCHEFVCGGHRFDARNPYVERAHQLYLNSDVHLAELYQYWCEYVHMVNDGFRPDIVDAPDYMALGYFFVLHRLLGYPEAFAPLLTSCHANSFAMRDLDSDLDATWPNLLLRQREKFQLVGADERLAVSRFMAQKIHSRYHLPEPHVYYTCSPHARPESCLPPCDNNELLYFGQFRYLKGLLPLLRVCRNMWEEGHAFVLKLQGASQWYTAKETDMAAYIRREYGRYVAGGMLRLFPHAEDFATIRDMLLRSRAVVHPSLMESLSHSCIEALSHGRPVIASDCGGHTELVQHGVSGFIYSDDRGLEAALRRMLAASSAELGAWGLNANRRMCEMVAVERSLPTYERICGEVTGRGWSGGPRRFPGAAFADRQRFAAPPEPDPGGRDGAGTAGLLHVIMPCFNHGQFLGDALASILASGYRPLRITVVDDASTDALSRDAFARLETRFSAPAGVDIRWVREPRNVGPAAIRSRWGLDSDAEFLCFVDADDRVRPGYFARAIALLQRYDNIGFVGGWIESFGRRSFAWIISDVDLPLFLMRNQAMGPSVIRRCAWQGQSMAGIGEDHDGYLAMIEKGWLGVNLPETVYDYRVGDRSLYHAATASELRLMMSRLARRHDGLYRLFGDELFRILVQNHLFGSNRRRSLLARLKKLKNCRVRSAIGYSLACPRRLWKLPAVLLRVYLGKGSG